MGRRPRGAAHLGAEDARASLREQLKIFQFWSLETCVILGLAMCAVVLRDLPRVLDRRDILILTMLLALALGLTLGVAPRTNRIYYDEQIYQNVGQNLADLRLAQMCNDGTIEHGRLRCSSGRIQQAAVRLSACAEFGLPRFRRRDDNGFCGERHGDGGNSLLSVSVRRHLVLRPRGRILRRTPPGTDPGAARVVGDRGGRALRLVGVGRRAPCCGVFRTIEKHGVARRSRRRSGVRGPVST